ncbi:hypothetical protein Droror1_Dr00002979 [Drosera rotundifolia]
MDLETENRIAAILLKEAAELRREAQKEGVLAYIRQPKARHRPNSRFLTATVLGIQQANRAVEVNEMWRSRQKELELDNKLKGKSKSESRHSSITKHDRESSRSTSRGHGRDDDDSKTTSSSSKKSPERCRREEDSLREEDLREFLNSRAKRGRGSVGPRMDETGPYLPQNPDDHDDLFGSSEKVSDQRHRVVLGPEIPSSWKRPLSSEDEQDDDRARRKKQKGSGSGRSKERSILQKSKDKSIDKKRKRKEERRVDH